MTHSPLPEDMELEKLLSDFALELLQLQDKYPESSKEYDAEELRLRKLYVKGFAKLHNSQTLQLLNRIEREVKNGRFIDPSKTSGQLVEEFRQDILSRLDIIRKEIEGNHE